MNPLKQGLKRDDSSNKESEEEIVKEVNPLKQGLKPRMWKVESISSV